jgi:hypothetical protein
MKTYGGVNIQIRVFLTSALVGGEWSVSRPGSFTLGARVLGGPGGPQSQSGRRGEE